MGTAFSGGGGGRTDAVQLGHHHIEHHDIRRVRLQVADALDRVGEHSHVESVDAQAALDDAEQPFVVIDNHRVYGLRRNGARRRHAGRQRASFRHSILAQPSATVWR